MSDAIPLRVIYDARWVPADGKFDGVGRYSQELGLALAEQPGIELTWLIHDKLQLTMLSDRLHIIGNDPNDLWAERFKLPTILEAARPDVVYSPFFLIALAQSPHYKLVATIHDTIYYHYRTPPHWLPPHVRAGWWLFHAAKWPMRRLLNRADYVATVSDTAKAELEAWQMTERPITAVKNAVSDKFRADVSSIQATDRSNSNIIVHHGAVTQYKNVELIIDALPLMPDIEFHILGRAPAARMTDLVRRITDRGVTKRVTIHNGVSDSELLDMLSRCRCLVSPSRIEGFGLPVIEAQLRGAPVICADTPIYHEIAGRSVLFVALDSPEELAAAVKVLGDPEANHRYVAAGLENARRYTWQASAEIAARICNDTARPAN